MKTSEPTAARRHYWRMVAVTFLISLLWPITPCVKAAPAADEQTTYFLGESRAFSPDGSLYGSNISLVKRTLKRAEKLIVETIMVIDTRQPTAEQTITFKVDGSKISADGEHGNYYAAGTLKGEPWNWTAWEYEMSLTGRKKGSIKAECSLSADGLRGAKTVFDESGRVNAKFSEDLRPISKDMYQILHTKLSTAAASSTAGGGGQP